MLLDGKEYFKYGMLPVLALCGITAIEPSLSAAMAIGVAMMTTLFLSGVKPKRFWSYVLFLGAGVLVLMLGVSWRRERLFTLFGQGTVDYQIKQSILAIGSGGFLGKGLGNGTQKFLFLPELQNDFIFANIGEEGGLVACLIVIFLYIFIVIRGIRIANQAPDRFGFLYGNSVMVLLGFQALVNIGVATGVLPVTGMALPFVSAGGSSMLILFAMMGPILNMSRQIKYRKRKKR